MPPLSDEQAFTMIVLTTISSVMSILGSCLVIRFIVRSQQNSPYTRMMTAMTLFEIIRTCIFMTSPYLLPKSGGRLLALGNEQTCLMLGFFTQIGIGVPLYNISLNIYYIYTIVYGKSEKQFTRRIESTLHAINILYPLITASLGVCNHIYSELELGLTCWVGNYPKGCDENPDLPCFSAMIGWIFGGVPFTASASFLIFSNYIIFHKVNSTNRRTLRYDMKNVILEFSKIELHDQDRKKSDYVFQKFIPFHARRNRMDTNVARICLDVVTNDQKLKDTISSPATEVDNVIETTINPTLSRTTTLKISSQSRDLLRTRLVGRQAILYITACLNSIVWMAVLRILESNGLRREDESDLFWLSLLAQITYPMQGFWNFIIFFHPKYVRFRRDFPSKSRWWCIKHCLYTQKRNQEGMNLPDPPVSWKESYFQRSSILESNNSDVKDALMKESDLDNPKSWRSGSGDVSKPEDIVTDMKSESSTNIPSALRLEISDCIWRDVYSNDSDSSYERDTDSHLSLEGKHEPGVV